MCARVHTSVVFGVCLVKRSEGGSDFRNFLFLCCLARPLSRTELGRRGLRTCLVRDDLCLVLLQMTPLAGPPFRRWWKVVSEGKVCGEGDGRRRPGTLPVRGLPWGPHPRVSGGIWPLCGVPAAPAMCRVGVSDLCDKEVKEDRRRRPERRVRAEDRRQGEGGGSGKCVLRPQVRSQLERSVCVRAHGCKGPGGETCPVHSFPPYSPL